MRRNLFNFIGLKSGELRSGKWSHAIEELNKEVSVVDIGVWCRMPEPNPSENWVEKQSKPGWRLIAVGLENMSGFKIKYPFVSCVQADGCALPFKSGSIDVSISNAVLEHVNPKGQVLFASEMVRVARRQTIIAVPDRRCPIEIHSRVPFLHWFPGWRTLFRWVGAHFWASPDHLSTIFTRRLLSNLLNQAVGQKWEISSQKLWGIPISLIAVYQKRIKLSD